MNKGIKSIHSYAIQDFLETPPSWLLRSGMSFLFITVCTFLLATWFIKYPDVIPVKVKLTSTQPPSEILAQTSGKIERLFVEDGQLIKEAEVLAKLESFSTYEDILAMKTSLSFFNKKAPLKSSISFNEKWNLGELGGPYFSFIKALDDYTFFTKSNKASHQIVFSQRKIEHYSQLSEILDKQNLMESADLALSHKRFEADSILHSINAMTKYDFLGSKSTILRQKNNYLQLKSSKISLDMQKEELKNSIYEIRTSSFEKERELRTNLFSRYIALTNQVNIWERKYLLRSPIEGRVVFNKFWSINQNVNTGDQVMTIVSDNSTPYCFADLQIIGAGKVKTGQKVQIKFDNFPFQEYGFVTGYIKRISLVPSEDTYTILIDLPEGLKTNYRITLPFKQEIQGSAEIITDDIRLIERIFYQLRMLVDA